VGVSLLDAYSHCGAMSLATRSGGAVGLRGLPRAHINLPGLLAAGRNVGAAVRQYRRMAERAERGRRAANTDNSPQAPLTGNFDYKTDYKKRRLGRRARRRQKFRRRRARKAWRRSKLAATNTNHILKRSVFTLLTPESLSDSVCYGLYGISGTNASFNSTGDVGDLFAEMDSGSWAAANTIATPTFNHKIYFQHGTLEMTLRNTGTNDAIIEAYFIRGRSPVNTNWLSPTDVYSRGFVKQPITTNPGPALINDQIFETGLTYDMIGTTPFQNHIFTKAYTIYKRQKYRIPPGGEVNVVVSDPRPRTFGMVEAKTKITDRRYHGILFQQQGAPAVGDPPLPALNTSVTYMAVRRYRMKMVRDNLVTDAFDTSIVA